MITKYRSIVSDTRFVLMLVSLAFSAGCHQSAPANTTTVRGRVTFQGNAVAGGLIVFTPDPERGGSGKPISAETAQDGRFELKAGSNMAIPSGWYRVAIASAPIPGSVSTNLQSVFPPQLARPDQSGLIREIKAGQENIFDFAIETQ